MTLPKVDLSAEDGTTFENENRTYTIKDESELTNVSLPAVILDDRNATSFLVEKVTAYVRACVKMDVANFMRVLTIIDLAVVS